MTYSVHFSDNAADELERISVSDRRIGRQIASAVNRLATHPNLGKSLKGEWAGYFKYRTGRYRIIYRAEHAKILIFIVTIDHRKDVYR
jgi:mRNA interferase RelE/StbE